MERQSGSDAVTKFGEVEGAKRQVDWDFFSVPPASFRFRQVTTEDVRFLVADGRQRARCPIHVVQMSKMEYIVSKTTHQLDST